MFTTERALTSERRNDASASVSGGDRRVEIDTPTMVTVSALAWVTANVLHEIVGHAGAAVMLGIPVRAVSTTTAFIEWWEIESATQVRIIAAAATPVNVLTGALALAALRWLNVKSTPMRYFLWLFAAVSFVMATWNMVTLPLLGEGDWGDVAEGLDHAGLWTAGVVAAGIVMTIVGYRLSLRLFMPDLSSQPASRHKIVLVALSTMIVVQTLSVTLSPFATAPAESNHLVASVFAYAHLVVWALLVYRGVGPHSTRPTTDIAMDRSIGWLAAGLVVVMFFIAVLGPGLGPLEDDPRLHPS